MTITHTVDAVELAWTIVSLLGLLLSLDLYRQAREDQAAVEEAQPDDPAQERRWRLECAIVVGDVTSARWIVAQEVVSSAIGFLALSTPQPPGGRTALGWVLVAGLLAIATMLPLRLYGQRRRRRGLALGRNSV